MELTRDEMLQHLMASNAAFDRVFVTGVLSTGIYCLPSCKARKPKPENVQFFTTIDEAKKAGLRACKKCRPDAFYAGSDPDLETLEGCVAAVRRAPGEIAGAKELSELAGMSQSKLFLCVRKHYQITPGELILRAKVNAARNALISSTNPISDIAFAVGFESLSTFYDHFGRLTGMTPTSYRSLSQAIEFTVDLPRNYRSEVLVGYLGRDPDSLTERVDGDSLWVGCNIDDKPTLLEMQLHEGHLTCKIAESGKGIEAHRIVERLLGLAQDPDGFQSALQKTGMQRLTVGREGYRLPLTPTPFDAVVWAILGQQVNLKFAYSLRNRLTRAFGSPLANGMYAPPMPKELANLTPEDLLPFQFSRRKAEYLTDFSKALVTQGLSLADWDQESATRVERRLLDIRGFGPWSTHYLMMRGFGFPDCVPLGDTGLTSALKAYFELETRPDSAMTRSMMAPFAPYRSLATLHLWQSLHFES